MLGEFAVEPAAVAANPDRFFGLIDRFGPEHGRVVSDFADGRWSAAVMRAAEAAAFREIELKSVEERLRELRDRRTIVRTGRIYPRLAGGWIANARVEDARDRFHAVISEQGGSGCHGDCRAADARGDRAPFQVDGFADAPRTAVGIAGAAAPLLRFARQAHLIDPHVTFDGSAATVRRWAEPLAALAAACRPDAEVVVHLRDDDAKPPADLFEQRAQRQLGPRLAAGRRVTVRRWRQRPGGEPFHDRAVLTDMGGLSFGHGLDAGAPGATVQVQRLDRSGWSAWLAKFEAATSSYDLAQEFIVEGAKG